MTWLNELGRRLRALVRRDRLVRELDEEMRLHVQLRQERLEASNLSSEDARTMARRRFGNATRLREDAVDAWGWQWWDQLLQDVRIGMRTLVHSPAFALTAIVTLALGIGANTAIFSIVNGVLLRPLPLADPDRLVQIYGTSQLNPAGGPLPNVLEYRRQTRTLQGLAGCEFSARYMTSGGGEPEQVITVQTERPFFMVLGVPPMRGRVFTDDDPAAVAVITERFWKDRFGGDPSAVGRTVLLDDEPFSIIGVMPESFQYPYRTGSLASGGSLPRPIDMWIPFSGQIGPRSRIGRVTGRLNPGVSLAAAQSELSAIAAQLAEQYPDTNRGTGVRIEPLQSAIVSPAIRQPLYVLLGVVGLVLALACANVANLSLVRVTLRGREVAVRSALGAGRLRLMRQFLTESIVLSAAGGAVGLALGWWGMHQLMGVIDVRIPRAHEVGLDWRVFLFLFGACTLTSILVGLAPALLAGRSDAQAVLREGAHSTMSAGSQRLRDGLAIAEVAMAFVLAIAATLLIRELVRLRTTDPGMTTSNVVTFHVGHRMTPQTDTRQFYEIAGRVSALSGVRAAGFIQLLPLQTSGWNSNSSVFRRRGEPAPSPQDPVYPIELRYVTPGYFQALGIPVRRGRGLSEGDDKGALPVILINEALARRAFPGVDPIGIETTRGTIVGIVGDVRQAHLDRPADPEIYYPIAQNWSQLGEHGLTLVVGTRERPEPLIDSVRTIIREVNPKYAVFRVKTMDTVVAESLSDFTLYLLLIVAAAGLALVLAMTGTYGVVSYIAASRTREFAIRVALGADRARVTRLVVRDGVRLAAAGIALGVVGAFAGRGLLGGLPITVRPPDLATTVPIAIAVAIIVALACLVPARRAAAGDPIKALKSE
jgi:predicted permease